MEELDKVCTIIYSLNYTNIYNIYKSSSYNITIILKEDPRLLQSLRSKLYIFSI